MNEIKNLKMVVNVSIPFINPINLESLAKDFKNSSKFPDMQSSFEFPPKPIKTVIKLLFNKEYKKLNFFDIARLLTQLENDKLGNFVSDKLLFSTCLQELFNDSEKYIQNLILKITTKIFISTNENRFRKELKSSLNSKEFMLIGYCTDKKFNLIHNTIVGQSLKKVLKFYGVSKILSSSSIEYSTFLLEQVKKVDLNDKIINAYKNNLLLEDDLDILYQQTDTLINIIGDRNNPKNDTFIEEILLFKLGNIEDKNSNWYKLSIPVNLQEKYKRLKGLFEFQRFVDIAIYLSKHTDLKNSNLSKNGKTSDATRILSRSDFWSNYDERFSSVKMWVSEEDYRMMLIDKPVELSDIKQLKNIKNEACMLEFKEKDLLIIEFFRQRDSGVSRKSLIFQSNQTKEVKDILFNNSFSMELYNELVKLSSFKINHNFLWQGWVDKFLTNKEIYPNESILNGTKKFQSHSKVVYKKGIGLEETRIKALNNERVIQYQDIISKN